MPATKTRPKAKTHKASTRKANPRVAPFRANHRKGGRLKACPQARWLLVKCRRGRNLANRCRANPGRHRKVCRRRANRDR